MPRIPHRCEPLSLVFFGCYLRLVAPWKLIGTHRGRDYVIREPLEDVTRILECVTSSFVTNWTCGSFLRQKLDGRFVCSSGNPFRNLYITLAHESVWILAIEILFMSISCVLYKTFWDFTSIVARRVCYYYIVKISIQSENVHGDYTIFNAYLIEN